MSRTTLITLLILAASLAPAVVAQGLSRETAYAKHIFEIMKLDPGKDGLIPRRPADGSDDIKQWEFRAIQHPKTAIMSVASLRESLGHVTFNNRWRDDVGDFYAAWVFQAEGEPKMEAWILTDKIEAHSRKFRLVIQGF